MTVKVFAETLGYETLSLPDPDKNISGGYVGDLLSSVMVGLSAGDAWVTVMANVNILAVAKVSHPSCIILAHKSKIEAPVLRIAEERGINILRSCKTAYEICLDIDRSI